MMTPDNATKDPRGDRISGRIFFQAIWQHPVLFALVLLLTAASAAGVWYGLPLPRHTGSVVFNVSSQAPAVLSPSAEARVDFHTYRQTQSAIVKQRQVLADALRRPEVRQLSIVREQSDPLAWLEARLAVDFRSGTEIMRVTLEGDDADELRILLGAVAQSYLAAADERENGQRRQRLNKLEAVQREHQARLDSFQKAIDTIAVRLGSKDGATLAIVDQLTREELAQATRELHDIEAQLQLAAPATKRGSSKSQPSIPASLVEERLRREPTVVQIEADVARARAKVSDIEQLLKPGTVGPVLLRARDEVKAAEDRLAQAKAELRPKIEAALRDERIAEAERREAQDSETVDRLQRRHAALNGRIEEIKDKIGENNRFRIDLENLKSQIAHTDKLTAAISEESERLKMELGAPPRVTLAEEPYAVSGIQGNRRLKMTMLITLGVFLLGYGSLVAWEYGTRRVSSTRELSNGLGLKLLGTVPPVSAAVRANEPHMALAEAIDTTRTMLLHGAAGDRQLRTFLVTSAVEGEGKTSLAGHLAISLARAGYSTLLVDGDVRAPSAHDLFDIPGAPGLCEVLSGEVILDAVIYPTAIPGLSVLPGGAWDIGVRQSLAGTRWGEVRRALESVFDFVVVDSGPVLAVSDSLLLARDVDGVLLSVLLDVSRVSSVEETRDRLRAIGANVLGVVVNGVVTPSYWSAQSRSPVVRPEIPEAIALPA
jgi:capsular exopolysaccharide synthesis family protein